jgi:lysozyme
MWTFRDDMFGADDDDVIRRTKRRIRMHEGCRSKPYKCSEGFTTIGIGRNLDANGLSDDEVEYLFNNDFRDATQDAAKLPVWKNLDAVRRGVLVEMVFQMGLGSVRGFRNTLKAMENKDWPKVHAGMLASKWARQTPGRAKRLAGMMLTGQFDD